MARVYVGTYGKYNSGSLAGAWINLDDCATYSDFLTKCAAAHKDERDPEFMIQDAEGFPDGLSILESLSEDDFNDVKAAEKEEAQGEAPAPAFTVVDYSEKAIAVTGDTRAISDKLKALGGRFNPRLTCGAGWIFSKRQEEAVRALLSGAGTTTAKAEAKKEEGAPFLAALDEWLGAKASKLERDNAAKWYAAAVKLQDGFLVIEKPSIENKFCFHDEGPDYETYKTLHKKEENLRAYFLNHNLSDLDARLKWLEKEDDPVYVDTECCSNGRVYLRTRQYSWDYCEARNKGFRELSVAERKQCAAAVRFVRAAFEKRIQTYLKRYGVSKIHTWTYWADA